MKLNYRELMDRCFELAEEAKLRGDSAVGSLVVDADGKIVTEASEQNRTQDIFAHAEFLVIQQAIGIRQRNDLHGFTLVTTNEPCFLCSFAIRHTSISKVVCAKATPGIGGITSNYPILSANDINDWRTTPEIVFISEN
jgi:tRNA(adenine34) deaminase